MFNNLHRAAVLEGSNDTDVAAGIVRLSFASEARVLRRDDQFGRYYEVLSHSPGDANLGLLNRAGVLLEGHDDHRVIGDVVPDSARVEADRRTRAKVRVSDPAWRERVARGEFPKGVSVGYSQLSVVERAEAGDGTPVLKFSWQPYEVSFLRDDQPPADDSVGVNRARPSHNMPNSIDRLLEAALSGTRATEGRYTREQIRDEFSLGTLLRGEPDSFTREIAESPHSMSRSSGGSFVPFSALCPRRRDTQATIFAQGGAFVPTDLHDPAIELLRNHCVAVPLGAKVISGLKGNFAIPQIMTGPTVQSLTEIAGATASNIVTNQQALAPCRVTTQINVSTQLLKQTGGAFEDVLRQEIAAQIGVNLDQQLLFGTGSQSQIQGLTATSGVSSMIWGGPASWSGIVANETALANANADFTSRLGWAISPSTRARWRSIPKSGGGATVITLFLLDDAQTVAGYPALASNQLSGQNQSILADWSQLWILIWGDGLDFVINPYTQAPSGKTVITAHLWANLLVRHAQSFCVSADAANQ